MAKKQRFQGSGYAVLFFVLFLVLERVVENLLFTSAQQAAHMTVTTFVQVLLACVSWYLGRRIAESRQKK